MEYQAPDFDSIKISNPYGAELWSARDLQPLLGYKQWRQFERAIKDAQAAIEGLGMPLGEHLAATRKEILGGNKAKMQVDDYILSRFAAYMVAQNGDPRKPEIQRAQAYFATQTRANEIQQLYVEQQQRLELRERVSEGNINLSAQARQSGVPGTNMGEFHNQGYKGLYGGLTAEGIRQHKQIDARDEIMDVASSQELAANWFRITQTQAQLREKGVTEEAIAMMTHFEVGQKVRKAIADIGGKMPEELPPAPTIRPLLDDKKRRAKKHAKELPKPAAPDEPEQSTMF